MYSKKRKDAETISTNKNKKKKVTKSFSDDEHEETTGKRKIDPKSRKQEAKKQKDTQDTRNSKVTSERTKDPPESSSTRRPITEDLRSDSTSSIEALVNKMMRQNHTVNQKIDKLQLTLEEVLAALDNSTRNKNLDQGFIDNVVKKVAKILFRTSIYPMQDEFYDATKEYLLDNHEDFIKDYSERRWKTIYERDFYKPLIKSHRSFRGTLTSRIKEAVFSVFGEVNLPTINMSAPPGEIQNWKRKSSVRSCYKKLFKPIKQDDVTYIYSILRKVWPTSNLESVPDLWIAYAVGISEILLNPNILTIQASESKMRPKLKKYLKVVDKLLSNETFSSNTESSDESGSEIKEPVKEDHEIEVAEGSKSAGVIENENKGHEDKEGNEDGYEEGNKEEHRESYEGGNKDEIKKDKSKENNKGKGKGKEIEDEYESEEFIPPEQKEKLRKKYKGY